MGWLANEAMAGNARHRQHATVHHAIPPHVLNNYCGYVSHARTHLHCPLNLNQSGRQTSHSGPSWPSSQARLPAASPSKHTPVACQVRVDTEAAKWQVGYSWQ